jgi:hypothetical protein
MHVSCGLRMRQNGFLSSGTVYRVMRYRVADVQLKNRLQPSDIYLMLVLVILCQ